MLGTVDQDEGKVLTGKERYPIVGNRFSEEKVAQVLEAYKDLNIFWDCLNKAVIAQEILGEGLITLGGLLVWSEDYTSNYGYYWNPPHELHAWVHVDYYIFDAGLPGVITKGLITCDDIGPAIVGRGPCVLAGAPKRWMEYKPRRILQPEQVRMLVEDGRNVLEVTE
jgi:hypothetical protein